MGRAATSIELALLSGAFLDSNAYRTMYTRPSVVIRSYQVRRSSQDKAYPREFAKCHRTTIHGIRSIVNKILAPKLSSTYLIPIYSDTQHVQSINSHSELQAPPHRAASTTMQHFAILRSILPITLQDLPTPASRIRREPREDRWKDADHQSAWPTTTMYLD